MTRYDKRNSICKEALAKVKGLHGDLVFEPLIHTNVSLQTAPAYKKSIYEYAPESKGSEDYLFLTDEVLDRLKLSSEAPALKLVDKKKRVVND